MKKNILVILIVFLFIFVASQPAVLAKYISVVDSGSTGSEIHLFNVTNDNGEIKYKVFQLKDNDHHIGIANINPEYIADYVAPLIKSLKNGLPQGVDESDVDFYFMSTGDMRTVSPPVQEEVFLRVNEYLRNSTKLNVKFAGTMPERMEGVFDWLGVNLFEKKIGTEETYGVIDIGGATIQIAYAVNEPSRNTQSLKIGNSKYLVHARSYLGIGNDHLREQYLDNPNCIPRNLALVTVTGNGNYEACLSSLNALLKDVHNLEPIPQSVLEKTKFAGIAYFYYLTNSKPFSLGPEVSINDIKAKAETFAMMTWEEMKAKWPKDQYLHGYYIGSALIIDLLQMLGFDPNTKIKALLKVDGAEVSWALGAAVYYEEGNK